MGYQNINHEKVIKMAMLQLMKRTNKFNPTGANINHVTNFPLVEKIMLDSTDEMKKLVEKNNANYQKLFDKNKELTKNNLENTIISKFSKLNTGIILLPLNYVKHKELANNEFMIDVKFMEDELIFNIYRSGRVFWASEINIYVKYDYELTRIKNIDISYGSGGTNAVHAYDIAEVLENTFKLSKEIINFFENDENFIKESIFLIKQNKENNTEIIKFYNKFNQERSNLIESSKDKIVKYLSKNEDISLSLENLLSRKITELEIIAIDVQLEDKIYAPISVKMVKKILNVNKRGILTVSEIINGEQCKVAKLDNLTLEESVMLKYKNCVLMKDGLEKFVPSNNCYKYILA